MNNGHLMETTAVGTRCSRCLRTAAQLMGRSKSCPGKPWYLRYDAPDHLLTRTQLHQSGLRATGPVVGYVVNAWATLVPLFDLAETKPRRGESERQREARLATWEKTREKWCCRECGEIPASIGELRNHWKKPGLCEGCAIAVEEQEHRDRLERDRRAACAWAADLFANPTSWAMLDSETSSLDGVALEVAIIDAAGILLFHSLVNPDGAPIDPRARRIHGLTDEELAAAPRLSEIWPAIVEALGTRTKLIAYNAAFDQARLEQSARRYDLPALPQRWECAMLHYAAYAGDWSETRKAYRWVALGGGHRAEEDCRAALQHLHWMAEDAEQEAAS